MKVNELNKEYKVFYSALDRIVKQVSDQIFETYHITVTMSQKILVINTVEFSELNEEEINQFLKQSGLKYVKNDQKIVQLHDETDIIEDHPIKLNYVLADRLSISGYINDTVTYNFENASELNEILLEHDIPIRFNTRQLQLL